MPQTLHDLLRKQILKDRYFPVHSIDVLCDYIIADYYEALEQDGIAFIKYEKNVVADIAEFVRLCGGYKGFDDLIEV